MIRTFKRQTLPRVAGKLFRLAAVVMVLSSVAVATSAFGQENRDKLLSLHDWLSLPKGQQEPSYPYVRCAAIFSAIVNYVGAAKLGTKATQQYRKSIMLNLTAALLIRKSRNRATPLPEISKEMMRDLKALSRIYDDRMHRNYQRTGQAVVNDKLIIGDTQICKVLTEKAVEAGAAKKGPAGHLYAH